MKQHNYKKGDKVRIIGNGNATKASEGIYHNFSIGDVVTISHTADAYLYCEKGGLYQAVSPQHVEPCAFTRDDIKAGHLLVVKQEVEDKPFYMTVVPGDYNGPDGLGCCCPGKEWWPLSCFDKDTLVYEALNTNTILRVYGPTTNKHLLDNTTEDRELLWERQEKPKAVKMTVAEISEKLGYDVEIVKEK